MDNTLEDAQVCTHRSEAEERAVAVGPAQLQISEKVGTGGTGRDMSQPTKCSEKKNFSAKSKLGEFFSGGGGLAGWGEPVPVAGGGFKRCLRSVVSVSVKLLALRLLAL